MSGRTVISAPFPSLEATARELGVDETRVRQLTALVEAIVEGRDGRVVRLAAGRPARQRRAAVRPRKVLPGRRKQASRRTAHR